MKKFIYQITVILNIIVAASLLMAYLSVVIHPATIGWLCFFGLAYLHLFSVNFCFVTFWIFSRKKKMIMISIASILMGLPVHGRNIQLFEKKLPEDEKQNWNLKVLSFNVQLFEQGNVERSENYPMNIFDFFHDEDPDIICMQEFAVYPWHDELCRENIHEQFNKTPHYHVELTVNHSLPSNRLFSAGIATFSKYPIIRNELICTDSTANACMYSDLLIGSDTVRLFNIHLIPVSFQIDDKRLINNMFERKYDKSDIHKVKSIFRQIILSSHERANQVEIICSHIEQSPYPVIICGDFNDTPNSFSYQKVRGNRKDAFVEAGSGLSATSFNYGRFLFYRIDCIMYSDVFKAYDYECPRVYISDHFPVMCRLVKRTPKT